MGWFGQQGVRLGWWPAAAAKGRGIRGPAAQGRERERESRRHNGEKERESRRHKGEKERGRAGGIQEEDGKGRPAARERKREKWRKRKERRERRTYSYEKFSLAVEGERRKPI